MKFKERTNMIELNRQQNQLFSVVRRLQEWFNEAQKAKLDYLDANYAPMESVLKNQQVIEYLIEKLQSEANLFHTAEIKKTLEDEIIKKKIPKRPMSAVPKVKVDHIPRSRPQTASHETEQREQQAWEICGTPAYFHLK